MNFARNQLWNSRFFFYTWLFLVPKKNGKLHPIIDFSNFSVYKETTIQDGNNQVSMTNDTSQRLGCLHRSDRCLSTHSDSPSIQEVPSFHVRKSGVLCLKLGSLYY